VAALTVASVGVVGCGGAGDDGGSPPSSRAPTSAAAASFDPASAQAPFDPCEALTAAAAELSIPLYANIDPTELELPGGSYVAFSCSAPIDDGRNLTLTVKAIALADAAAARSEMESLGDAFGEVTVEEGLESLPEGSFVAQGANGESPELYVLNVEEPMAVAVVGGGTNADLELAKQVAAFLLDRS
jgi:hypothetical protein